MKWGRVEIDIRFVLLIIAPLLVLLVLGYTYVRSANRGMAAQVYRLEEQNEVLHGEVYRLRQERDGAQARYEMAASPTLQRLLATAALAGDSSSCWLYLDRAKGRYYADPLHATSLESHLQYRLYALDSRGGAPKYLGSFEALKGTVGFQSIGKAVSAPSLAITVAGRESEPDFASELLRYLAEGEGVN